MNLSPLLLVRRAVRPDLFVQLSLVVATAGILAGCYSPCRYDRHAFAHPTMSPEWNQVGIDPHVHAETEGSAPKAVEASH